MPMAIPIPISGVKYRAGSAVPSARPRACAVASRGGIRYARRMGLFIEHLVRDPWFFFSWTLIVVFSICVHEYAHARVALSVGDAEAAMSGHLTLNPLKQMGWMSLAALMVVGFAWGAVPVNPARYARKSDSALVAFSGPAANLLLCFVAAVALALATRFAGAGTERLLLFLRMAAAANATLFVLNLLPAPMLDGWSVLEPFVPPMADARRQYGPTLSWASQLLLFATPLSNGVWRAGAALSDAAIRSAVRVLAG